MSEDLGAGVSLGRFNNVVQNTNPIGFPKSFLDLNGISAGGFFSQEYADDHHPGKIEMGRRPVGPELRPQFLPFRIGSNHRRLKSGDARGFSARRSNQIMAGQRGSPVLSTGIKVQPTPSTPIPAMEAGAARGKFFSRVGDSPSLFARGLSSSFASDIRRAEGNGAFKDCSFPAGSEYFAMDF